ncbi:ankyrin repeat-containing protein [Tieghemostelium lacteum]|uniref:non-specific serine/threonine protein kinase n=1 Tax=Tieghemostelium lacteum TaxID=361077 RepID=A0A151Z9K0_TIELA|nr:ankyrin repeat-containing protein [Tieghemostelium lacteum]|eukprot:KYQ90612.1 ankyrin repeat-containing protein [Tieghemostelium lacteum]
MSKKGSSTIIGVVSLEVLEGRNLIPMDSDGKSDPYCVFLVGDKKKKTKSVKHTLNPKWENEAYEFQIDDKLQHFTIEVYDWDRFSSDDRMGMVQVSVDEFQRYTEEMKKWYTLVPIKPDDKVSGEIKLKIKYEKIGTHSTPSLLTHGTSTSNLHGHHHHHHQLQEKPLIKYIKEGDIMGIETLVAKSKIDYNVCDLEGTPSIHLAAASNNLALMNVLLKGSELKISCKDTHGNNALHILAHNCTNIMNEDIILKFIEKGCSVTDENLLGETPLHKACLSQIHKPIVIETLLDKGSNINATNKNGDTALHYAIKLGRVDFVSLLIQRGADFTKEGGKPVPKKPMDLALELANQSIVNKIKQAQEITDWLNNLQLESLVGIFLQNELYLDVVPDIDDSTLDRLNITITGHRTKLMRAVKRLKGMSSISGSSENLNNLSHGSNSGIVNRPSSVSMPPTPLHLNNNNSNSNIPPSQATTSSHGSNSNHNSHNSTNTPTTTTTTTTTTSTTTPSSTITTEQTSTTNGNTNNNNNDEFESELSQLRHVHLSENDEWIIDESYLKFGPLLGTGASGKVYKGFYKDQEVAIKVLKSFSDPKDRAEFKKEFQIVSSLRAPGVVYFYGAGFKDKLCIVMEYCSRGSLYHILKDESWIFTWDRFFSLASQAISSLNSLHEYSPQVLHRDLKSLNFLVTENWTVKICDFGLSRFDTCSNIETLGKLRGTYAYVAPEVYFGTKYTTNSDVYSMGMILWEMLYRCVNGLYQFPYQEYSHLKFDYQILISSAKKDVRPSFPKNSPPSLVELIQRTLLKESSSRPSTIQFLQALQKIQEEYENNRADWDALRSTPFHPDSENFNKSPQSTAATVSSATGSPSSVSSATTESIVKQPILPSIVENSSEPVQVATTESIKTPTSMFKEQIMTRNRSTSSPINPNFFVKPTESELGKK